MALTHPVEKAAKWKNVLDQAIDTKAISHATLESLVAKLRFAQNSIYNRFDRTQIQPLYAKRYSFPYYDRIHGLTLRTFKWRTACLPGISERVIGLPNRYPDVFIYTDASFGKDGGAVSAVRLGRYI